MEERIRVLIAKPGLDGHDRGALIIAQALRDAGMEVIYTGLRQTPAQIVKAAIQEDVDCIGLSSLSGAHKELFTQVMQLLKEEEADDILVVGGGVIPEEDIPYLLSQGIARIFTPGASLQETVAFIRSEVAKRKAGKRKPPKKIDHIGIAVQNLEQALSFFRDALGLRTTGTEVVESERVKVAFLPVGDTRIELLEATSDDSPIARFIGRRGEGIHHLALEVDDVDQTLRYMERLGYRPVEPEAKEGARGSRIAFLHPKSTHGVLIELCQKGDGHE